MIGMSVAAEIRNSWGRRTGVSSFAVRCDSPVLGGRAVVLTAGESSPVS